MIGTPATTSARPTFNRLAFMGAKAAHARAIATDVQAAVARVPPRIEYARLPAAPPVVLPEQIGPCRYMGQVGPTPDRLQFRVFVPGFASIRSLAEAAPDRSPPIETLGFVATKYAIDVEREDGRGDKLVTTIYWWNLEPERGGDRARMRPIVSRHDNHVCRARKLLEPVLSYMQQSLAAAPWHVPSYIVDLANQVDKILADTEVDVREWQGRERVAGSP